MAFNTLKEINEAKRLFSEMLKTYYIQNNASEKRRLLALMGYAIQKEKQLTPKEKEKTTLRGLIDRLFKR